MTEVQLTSTGNSLGVILPKEVSERLEAERGDMLLLLGAADGIDLTPFDPEVARQLDEAERVMREDRDVLRKLAE